MFRDKNVVETKHQHLLWNTKTCVKIYTAYFKWDYLMLAEKNKRMSAPPLDDKAALGGKIALPP